MPKASAGVATVREQVVAIVADGLFTARLNAGLDRMQRRACARVAVTHRSHAGRATMKRSK